MLLQSWQIYNPLSLRCFSSRCISFNTQRFKVTRPSSPPLPSTRSLSLSFSFFLQRVFQLESHLLSSFPFTSLTHVLTVPHLFAKIVNTSPLIVKTRKQKQNRADKKKKQSEREILVFCATWRNYWLSFLVFIHLHLKYRLCCTDLYSCDAEKGKKRRECEWNTEKSMFVDKRCVVSPAPLVLSRPGPCHHTCHSSWWAACGQWSFH